MKFKKIFIIGLILFGAFLVFFSLSLRQIHASVQQACRDYQNRFGGNSCLEALRASIESIETSVEEKNHAIWAISQLGREEALPFLHELKEDDLCQLPSATDGCLSELLLDRAINFSENWTLTKWMYRKL